MRGVSYTDDVVLEAINITKKYGEVWALRGINLKLHKGEILGLVGDNGAGKSTFLKICIGALPPTSGELYILGKKVSFKSPREAIQKGLGIVYQEPAIIEELSVVENFFIAHEEIKSYGILKVLNWRNMLEEVEKFTKSLGFTFDVRKKAKHLSGGERQLITVARALYFKPKILFLDEPTTALSERTKREIFNLLIKHREEHKTSMIFVTHILEDAIRICDRIAILKHGKIIHEFIPKEGFSREELIKKIWGEE